MATAKKPTQSERTVQKSQSVIKNRPKIVFIGSGSTIFAKNLMVDIWSSPMLHSAHIVLYDINAERLKTSDIVAKKIIDQLKQEKNTPISPSVEVTQDIKKALKGAQYVVTMFQVGGYKPSTLIDFKIPKKYGLRQTIGDTLGIGGIMRALRTAPVLVDYARLMEKHCPNAYLLNYTNPMVMNCWVLNRMTNIKTIGLCHSIPYTLRSIAEDLKIPHKDITFTVAGINHMAFYLELKHKKRDLYPLLHRFTKSKNFPPIRNNGEGENDMTDHVRYEVMKRLGYFVTESSEHFSEYVPWFIKRGRDDLITQYKIPLDEYIQRCEHQIAQWKKMKKNLEHKNTKFDITPSVEYGSSIINSLEGGKPCSVYVNTVNNNSVTNLPSDCIVEIPCTVSKHGLKPKVIGVIPPHLAALIQTNINVQRLCVEAIVTGKKEHVYHAAMLDPHTAAELDLKQIWNLVDNLIKAHGNYISCLKS